MACVKSYLIPRTFSLASWDLSTFMWVTLIEIISTYFWPSTTLSVFCMLISLDSHHSPEDGLHVSSVLQIRSPNVWKVNNFLRSWSDFGGQGDEPKAVQYRSQYSLMVQYDQHNRICQSIILHLFTQLNDIYYFIWCRTIQCYGGWGGTECVRGDED